MRIFVVLSLFVAVSCAQAEKKVSPNKQTAAGSSACEKYDSKLVKALQSKGEKAKVSAPASSVHYFEVVEVSKDEWTELLLIEQPDVQFLEKPERVFNAEGFAGMASFTPKKSGEYFFSYDDHLWMDLIDHGQWTKLKENKVKSRMAPVKVQMNRDCEGLEKSVVYKLEAGKRYLMQLSSASKGAARVFISE